MTTIEGRLAALADAVEERLVTLEEAVRVHGLVLRSVDNILTTCMENELDNYLLTTELSHVTDDLERNIPRNEYGHTEEQAFMMARAFHILRHDQCPLADAAGDCQSFSWSPWYADGEEVSKLSRQVAQIANALPSDIRAGAVLDGDQEQGVSLVE
jgi:hypothetical protein